MNIQYALRSWPFHVCIWQLVGWPEDEGPVRGKLYFILGGNNGSVEATAWICSSSRGWSNV
jgi:hypothetical protein